MPILSKDQRKRGPGCSLRFSVTWDSDFANTMVIIIVIEKLCEISGKSR